MHNFLTFTLQSHCDLMDPFGPSIRHTANTALSAPGPHRYTSVPPSQYKSIPIRLLYILSVTAYVMCPRCMSTNYQAHIKSSRSMPWKSCPEGSTSPTSIVAAFLTCLVSHLCTRVLLHHARMQQTAGVPSDSNEHQKALRSSRFDAECRRDRRSIDHKWRVSR